jgi:hypothetical protein
MRTRKSILVIALLLANLSLAAFASREVRAVETEEVCLRDGCKCFGTGPGGICSRLGDGSECSTQSQCAHPDS